jgi:hypothetical protein
MCSFQDTSMLVPSVQICNSSSTDTTLVAAACSLPHPWLKAIYAADYAVDYLTINSSCCSRRGQAPARVLRNMFKAATYLDACIASYTLPFCVTSISKWPPHSLLAPSRPAWPRPPAARYRKEFPAIYTAIDEGPASKRFSRYTA